MLKRRKQNLTVDQEVHGFIMLGNIGRNLPILPKWDFCRKTN